jgi:hypothetical protein
VVQGHAGPEEFDSGKELLGKETAKPEIAFSTVSNLRDMHTDHRGVFPRWPPTQQRRSHLHFLIAGAATGLSICFSVGARLAPAPAIPLGVLQSWKATPGHRRSRNSVARKSESGYPHAGMFSANKV